MYELSGKPCRSRTGSPARCAGTASRYAISPSRFSSSADKAAAYPEPSRKAITSREQRSGSSSHTKWPSALDDDRLRAGNLPAEPVGALDRRVLVVVLAPQHQGRDAQLAQSPGVGLELLEVSGAVQLEDSATALLVRVRLPVLVDGAPVEARTHLAEDRGESVARDAVDQSLALTLGPQCRADTGPLAVWEEPGVADHQAAERHRVIERPPHADQASPVVVDEHESLKAESLPEALQRLDMALPGPGVSRSESPYPGKSGAITRRPAIARAGIR